MMDVETSYSDFINCDRTGRRNAVPDITGEGEVGASTSELTKDMAEMDLKAAEGASPGASPAPEAEGSTSQDPQGRWGPVLKRAGDGHGVEERREDAEECAEEEKEMKRWDIGRPFWI